jgi:hypothetical protein
MPISWMNKSFQTLRLRNIIASNFSYLASLSNNISAYPARLRVNNWSNSDPGFSADCFSCPMIARFVISEVLILTVQVFWAVTSSIRIINSRRFEVSAPFIFKKNVASWRWRRYVSVQRQESITCYWA